MHFEQIELLKPLLKAPRLGVITDMDGTISPIVATPSDALPTPRNRQILAQLAAQIALVAIISGRSAADVRERVGLDGALYVGNHGLEYWRDGQAVLAPNVAQYRPSLQAAAQQLRGRMLPGMWVEDKVASLSIHYRNTTYPDVVAARYAPIIADIADQHGLKMFSGRMIFELRPPLPIHKGTALRQLVEAHNLSAAVYLGDDTTDADALQMAKDLRAAGRCHSVGIGVLSDDTPDAVRSAADVLVEGVEGVESFLSWLASASAT